MRLSVVFELLLVFLFLAFAAARVIDKKHSPVVTQNAKKLRQGGPNRYCACTTNMCNCCRDFSLPVVPVKGPGCASIMYLKGDNMMVSMSFGERVLSNITLAGPKPKPVCMTLPGGISQFCGRVYGISRTEKNFKACLGLELRALDDIEAALRVSCFKFGPKGVQLESAPPIPPDETKEPDDEDEDDDDDYDLDDEEDDDLIGLGDDLDDDDDDDDEDDGPNAVSGNEGNEVDTDSADYTGFSVLGEDFFGTFFDDDTKPKKKKSPVKKTVKPVRPILKASTTTRRPLLPVKRPVVRPDKVTPVRKPINRVTLVPRSTTPKTIKTSTAPPAVPQFVSIPPIPALPIVNVPTKISSPTITTAASLPTKKVTTTTTEKLVTSTSPHTTTVEVPKITIKPDVAHAPEHTTQGVTYVKITMPSDEVKLPELDVEKIEAIAAIAQQGVTSSVIHSSALPVQGSGKVPLSNEVVAEEIRTEKYVPVPAPTVPMLKAGSPSKGSEEEEEEDDLLDGIIDDGIESDDENDGSNESQSNNVSQEDSEPSKSDEKLDDQNSISSDTEKPSKAKPEEAEEDDEEEESDDDFFDGIIDGDDGDDEDDETQKGEKEEDEKESVKDEEEEEDIIGAFVGDSDDDGKEESLENAQNDKEKSEEESEEEDDILSVLGDDNEEEDNAAEETDNEDEEDKPTSKKKHKIPASGKPSGSAQKPETSNKNSSSSSSSSSQSDENSKSSSEEILNTNVSGNKTDSNSSTDGSFMMTTTMETKVPNEEVGSSMNTGNDTAEATEQEAMSSTSIPPGITEAVRDLFSSDSFPTTLIDEEKVTTTITTELSVVNNNGSESGRFGNEPILEIPKSDALLIMKAAAKMREPQVLKLGDLVGPQKKLLPVKIDKPISTSRTHRRMNLDRWAPL